MKAKVFVTLKSGVLDPQGKAILHSTELLGYTELAEIRQGKYFEIEFNDGVSSEDARTAVEKIAADMLANPVIEDYSVVMSGE